LSDLDGGPFKAEKIVDTPGNMDRLEDWLKQVVDSQHLFYLVDLSRVADRDYAAAVRSDIKATARARRDSSKPVKRINFIASHLDQSKWSGVDAAEVNNLLLQQDDGLRLLYESVDGVAGYVYSANLMDKGSFKRLLQSIVDDCQS